MPPRTRKASGRTAAAATAAGKGGKTQQALSFGQQSRVTKPGARSASGDKKLLDDKVAAIERADIDEVEQDVREEDIKKEKRENDEYVRAQSFTASPQPEADRASETRTEVKKEQGDNKVTSLQGLGSADVGPSSSLAIRAQAVEEAAAPLSAEEEAATKVPEARIRRYWQAKEDERLTPRVHQKGLSLHEKVLREFDMSSQFGNCIGVPRTRRWRLAHELGLDPPIEVLAVLMKEGAKGGKGTGQRAYADELMTSRFVAD